MISKHVDVNAEDERPEEVPKAWECIAHLKLLTAFIHLREEISRRNNLFFEDQQVEDADSPEESLKSIREKRWTIYVARAVRRFERWSDVQIQSHSRKGAVTTKTCISKGAIQRIMAETEPFRWAANNIPPLDVIMVLHSFMLNPRWFLDDCLRLGMVSLWKAGMPWKVVNEAFDNENSCFEPSLAARQNFSHETQLQWNNLDDTESILFSCPVCEGSQLENTASSSNEWLSHKEFSLLCSLPCKNADHLRSAQISQLLKDIQSLERSKTPLRGTILSHDGLAESQTSMRPATLFPNRLFSLIDQKDLQNLSDNAKTGKSQISVTEFFNNRKEQSTKKNSKLRTAKGNPFSSTFTDAEVYSFNRTQLAYSEGPSLFSIDLTAAVLRQGKFVQQMRDIDWIHSPGLTGTIENLIDKYEVFVDIMRLSKKHEVSVPTLAVDLAWHTQQLSPEKYYMHCLRNINGVFVDHDDRIGEGDLAVAFKRTTEMFARLTDGGDYSECLCWHCGAMNECAANEPRYQNVSDADAIKELQELAWEDVRKAQISRFVDDWNQSQMRSDVCKWEEMLEGYEWPYPNYAPSQEDLALKMPSM